jgi:glycosyltransferase involved in cell wall biosynthesis
MVDLVILVDDGSSDETAKIARELGLELFVHDRNYGYGANQKTCYREALRAGATIVVMVHPDYQYDPTLLPEIIKPIQEDKADVVFGSRLMGLNPMKQGMPWWKYISNRFLTIAENTVFGLNLAEYHTGYRAFRPGSAGIREPADGFRQVHLRPGDCGATGQHQDAHHRSPGAHAVLRAGILGVVFCQFPSTVSPFCGCCCVTFCTARG